MQKIKFSTSINADRKKVWNVLWEKSNYENWTSVFMEGGYAVTDNWKEGTKVLFLGPDKSGMVSMVAANKPNEFMSFKHLGIVVDGVEKYDDKKGEDWSGSLENYTLKDENGKTELFVEMDVTEDHKDYFNKTWPLALEKVKQLSEN